MTLEALRVTCFVTVPPTVLYKSRKWCHKYNLALFLWIMIQSWTVVENLGCWEQHLPLNIRYTDIQRNWPESVVFRDFLFCVLLGELHQLNSSSWRNCTRKAAQLQAFAEMRMRANWSPLLPVPHSLPECLILRHIKPQTFFSLPASIMVYSFCALAFYITFSSINGTAYIFSVFIY